MDSSTFAWCQHRHIFVTRSACVATHTQCGSCCTADVVDLLCLLAYSEITGGYDGSGLYVTKNVETFQAQLLRYHILLGVINDAFGGHCRGCSSSKSTIFLSTRPKTTALCMLKKETKRVNMQSLRQHAKLMDTSTFGANTRVYSSPEVPVSQQDLASPIKVAAALCYYCCLCNVAHGPHATDSLA